MKRRLTRAWRSLRRRIGHAGIAGIVLSFAGLAVMASLPALRHAMRQSVASLEARTQAARRPIHVQARIVSPAEATSSYIGAFPSLGQNAADVAQVFAAAELRHLALPKGEYELKAEPHAPFILYTATFPVHGDYDALKGFGGDVLTALPHAAMEDLRMSRDTADSTTLNAVVRFTFYYRNT